jgi:hypothetical protein
MVPIWQAPGQNELDINCETLSSISAQGIDLSVVKEIIEQLNAF